MRILIAAVPLLLDVAVTGGGSNEVALLFNAAR